MRELALARFRVLTTIRKGTEMFAVAMLPPLIAVIIETNFSPQNWEAGDQALRMNASVALLAWLFHGFFLCAVAVAIGTTKQAGDPATLPVDLMDSAPVNPRQRFAGESAGTLFAAAIVHVCSLPLLLLVMALSPLPTHVFAWIECVIVAGLILGSSQAAWKRIAIPARSQHTRQLRVVLLFIALVLIVVAVTTDMKPFRDAVIAFLFSPSSRAWSELAASVDNPALMLVLFAMIVAGYLVFYFVSATRGRS